MKRSSRRLATVAAVLALGAVSGCSATSTPITQLAYAPTDGAMASVTEVGGVGVYNVILLTDSAQEPGRLIGRVVNATDEPQTLNLTGTGDAQFTAQVQVGAGQSLVLGPDDEDVLVEPSGAVPGTTVPVQVTTDTAVTEISVPVLDGTFDFLTDLVPTVSR